MVMVVVTMSSRPMFRLRIAIQHITILKWCSNVETRSDDPYHKYEADDGADHYTRDSTAAEVGSAVVAWFCDRGDSGRNLLSLD